MRFGPFAFAAVFSVSSLAFAQKASTLGEIELEGKLHERPGALDWLTGGKKHQTLRDVVTAIKKAATNDDLNGLLIRLKDSELTAFQVEEIGEATRAFRAAGKKVHVFSDGYETTGLMLGANADTVYAQSGSPVSLPGLYMEEMFLADTLSWIGVKAELVQIGAYKGANEQMTRSAPSPEWNQNIDQLLDSMYATVRETIKKGRKLDDAGLDKAMREAWMADADDAAKVGLIDAAVDLPKLDDKLKEQYKGEIEWEGDSLLGRDEHGMKMDMANPFAIFGMLSKSPDHSPKGPTIAIINIDGVIMDGDSEEGGLFGGEGSVGSRSIRNALEDVLEEDLIKGVVIRINSPGGSATASEVMWQGIRRVAEKKPVWVSVGGMAASGGYYCAVAGDKIYLNPSSIVGSIGVVGGKYAMGGLFDKVKVHVVPRARGPMAGMFRSDTEWSAQELEAVRKKMKSTYDQFTSRVTAGRKGIELSKTAEGRLFTGQKAIEMKMADAIGGLDTCIADLAKSLKLEQYDVMTFPGPKSLADALQDMMGRFGQAQTGDEPPVARAQVASMLQEIVGPQAWPSVRRGVASMLILRDHPVALVSPSVLVVK